tara:strand:+ start:187 stop:507 length:321 start_codon:yes stop_codon:yes gene_type:complete
MIPFIRSVQELIALDNAREYFKKVSSRSKDNFKLKNDRQEKIQINALDRNKIDLPDLPKSTRLKWRKGKKAVSKFFDELDYNNQIQSSYDLTLLASQNNSNHKDAA